MLQQTIAVLLVLGLLLIAFWLLKKRGLATFSFAGAQTVLPGQRRPDRAMRVIERVVLTPHHSLHLVAIKNRLVVFAVSPTSCQAVDQSLCSFDSDADGIARSRQTAAAN
jgi:flagellar biogenesis protein FliO